MTTGKHASLAYWLLLLFNLSFARPGYGQIGRSAAGHAVPVRSIGPHDTDYADLLPLSEAIGNKRIVMLGELYHGDAAAFQAKARLIRFLHEKMGFNVLAWESDFFALNHGWDAYKSGTISLDSLIYLSIFPVWTQCPEWQQVPQYVKDCAGKNELKLAGFDNRGYSGYGLRHLPAAIRAFLDSVQIPFVKGPSYSDYLKYLKMAPRMAGGKNRRGMDSLVHYTGLIIDQLPVPARQSFYGKLLESQLAFYKMGIYYRSDSIYAKTGKNYPLHDRQMAANLEWLARVKYPDEKIIVWAHNMHIEKGNADSAKHNLYNSMGRYFTKDAALNGQTYILGFTAYQGKGKLMLSRPAEKVTKPHKQSIENWLHRRGYLYAFLDFSKLNKELAGDEAPFFMKTYINAEAKAAWNRYFDGIFFIDEMKPCTEAAVH
ncbi:erythromycin esterase family protein [Chitinophaga sp. GCM10012297]|uniref:Erythromycin esterase family protein n=1 Tax=Chitinophaga chungangae TaxID=2821488 RepID=A0ABS3YA44_9BACT|nr:erythromycin esterase family protein [Chitinophaga chungangae]MBO9151552.1 erythromycin esterase family protein [Chitinophaga chungangae]